MERKAVSGIMLTLLFIGMLTLAFNIQLVKASGTIYIRASGSIDPPTANITSVDNVTYTFTGNINEAIVVERDNIVVDGAGYTVQGTGNGTGIDLSYRNNVTLKNVEVTNFNYGISLWYSSNNVLSGNTASSNNTNGICLSSSSNNVLSGNNASNNYYGIRLHSSSNNTLAGNNASNNYYGISLHYSSNNTLAGNTISNNQYGIWLFSSSDNVLTSNTATNNRQYGIRLSLPGPCSNNIIYHNNFIDNTVQASVTTGYVNIWDDGYPSGGNYWSDHVCTGNPSDGSQPYIIDANNIDYYPFQDSNGWFLPPPPPGYPLTIYSVPTGVTFTVDDIYHTTPWSRTYGEDASVSLVMPETYDGCSWSYWLEDGDPNRTKTVTMDTNTTLTAVFTDTTPPIISIVSPENKTYAVADVSLTFTVMHACMSWMGYSLDNQANVTITGNTTLSGLSEGTHNIIIYANNTSNNTGSSSKVYFTIDTTDTTPPIANAGPDQTVEEDTLLTFDGSGSWDNVGIVDYTWAFTDVTPQTLTGVNPTYNFTTPGVYVITLNVTDAAENWDTDTVVITVVNWGHAYMSVGNYIEYEYNFTGTYVGEMEGTIRAEVTEVHGNNYTARVDYSPTDGSDAWTETDSYLLGEDFMCPLTMMWQAEYVADETVQTKIGTVSASRYTTMGGIPEHDEAIYVHKESKILVLRILDGQTVIEITDTDIEWFVDQSSTFDVVVDDIHYPVSILSNSTVSNFNFNQTEMQISFDVTGESGTIGYCNVTIPKSLLTGSPWTIKIDDTPITFFYEKTNDTHAFLYFTYTHENPLRVTIEGTWIVPEFPPFLVLPLFMITTLLAVIIYRRKHST